MNKDKLKELSEQELFTLSRFMYKIGQPILSDVEYDELEKKIEGDNRTDYYSDKVPTELLSKVYTNMEINEFLNNVNKPTNSLERYVSRSMKSYRTLEECYNWITSHQNCEMCISPKIDGINTTTEYIKGALKYSRTRGRYATAQDITNNISKVLPNNVNDTDESLIVCGEAVYTSSKLNIVNDILTNYPGTAPLVTPRGGATSVLMRDIYPKAVYDELNVFVFRTNYGDTLSESLNYAESLGFKVVPHEVYKFKYQSYTEYVKEITDLIWKYKLTMSNLDIPTDGLVLQVNKREIFDKEIKDGFIEGGCLGVKAVGWEPGVYQSEVQEIIMEPSVFQYCTKALVNPVTTESGKRLSTVNLFNPSTLFRDGIKKGSIIEFQYKNETTLDYIRKIK